MHSIAILAVVFASLVSHAHGDFVMKSETYDFNATATDNKGKAIPVKGTMVNMQVVFISTNESQRDDGVAFKISANAPNGESADITNFFESVPTATFDAPPFLENSGQNNRGRPMSRSKIAPPAIIPPQSLIPPPNPLAIPPIQSNGSPSSPQSGPEKQAAHPEPLPVPQNHLPPQPLPSKAPKNSSASKSAAHASSSSPSSNTTADPHHKEPPSQRNSTAHKTSDTLNSRAKRSVSNMDHSTTAKPADQLPKTYKVQNMTIVPGNLTTSVNLSPIAGYPWIKNVTSDNNTQIYENAHYLNLRAPITNVSAFGSPFSLSDNAGNDLSLSQDSAGGEKHYDDLQSLLLSARQNATNNLGAIVEGFFNDSNAQSNVIEIATDQMTWDQLMDMEDGPVDHLEYGDSSSDETNESQKSVSPTQKASTPEQTNLELGGQTTNGTISGQTTNGTISGQTTNGTISGPTTNGTSGNATTENPSTAGSGNMLVSSWMVIFTSLIAIVSAFVV